MNNKWFFFIIHPRSPNNILYKALWLTQTAKFWPRGWTGSIPSKVWWVTWMGVAHWQPHTTAVNLALYNHAQTNCIKCLLDASHNRLCIYKSKHNYNWKMTLFLAIFWMDVTHFNNGPSMSKFWMLPVITSACESVNKFNYLFFNLWRFAFD